MRLSSIPKLWHRFWMQRGGRRALLLEAAFWLCTARLAILIFPFPRIARYLGKLHPPAGEANDPALNASIARDVSWAIDRAALIFPFRMVCLPRALAGWEMLHRRRITGQLHFGASRDASSAALRTHAWLDASGVEITGYPEAHECVEIGYFAR
jgi:hypothetical protein